jgi:hypothetical protein
MARLPALFVVQDGVAVVQDGVAIVAIVADTPTVDHETVPVSEGTGIFIGIKEVAEGMIRESLPWLWTAMHWQRERPQSWEL